MVGEETVKFLVLLVSGFPMLLLWIAAERTRIYRRSRSKHSGASSSLRLPLLVRLHERTLAGYWTLLIYPSAVVPLFLIPLCVYGVFWPEDVAGFLDTMAFEVPFLLVAMCCAAGILPAFPESKADHTADEDTVPLDSEGL